VPDEPSLLDEIAEILLKGLEREPATSAQGRRAHRRAKKSTLEHEGPATLATSTGPQHARQRVPKDTTEENDESNIIRDKRGRVRQLATPPKRRVVTVDPAQGGLVDVVESMLDYHSAATSEKDRAIALEVARWLEETIVFARGKGAARRWKLADQAMKQVDAAATGEQRRRAVVVEIVTDALKRPYNWPPPSVRSQLANDADPAFKSLTDAQISRALSDAGFAAGDRGPSAVAAELSGLCGAFGEKDYSGTRGNRTPNVGGAIAALSAAAARANVASRKKQIDKFATAARAWR
jgi:hypothetical protein